MIILSPEFPTLKLITSDVNNVDVTVVWNYEGESRSKTQRVSSATTTTILSLGLQKRAEIEDVLVYSHGVNTVGLLISDGTTDFRINQASLTGGQSFLLSEIGKIPENNLLSRGSNGDGEWIRLADGTQICWRTNLSVTNSSTASGSIFRSSTNATWTFPQAFIIAPSVSVDCDSGDAWGTSATAATTTAVTVRAFSGISIATSLNLRATAIGRWF